MSEPAIVQPRPAATVILVRDSPFEVLMVKRNERGPFASAFVFPGGVVEPQDYSESWLQYLRCDAVLGADERALRIAACRETWEEVAILPGGEAANAAGDQAAEGSFLEIVARQTVPPALDELVLFSHWITPESAPKRFDTRFYICRTPATNMGRCDGSEIVALEWLQPRDALASAERGDRSFLLPTQENLKLLAQSDNCADAIAAAQSRRILPITPRRVVAGDTVTFIVTPHSD
jgi:8-oxo-dGTP pyrophosphatase MutT (NUDIX family)